MERFLASAIPVYVMTAITVLGILGTWATGIYYRQMINQTENMMSARHAFLLQMKNRFENTYRVNKGINNVPLFVQKQLKGNRFLGISAEKAGRASQKAGILCLLFGGAIVMLQQVNEFEAKKTVTFLGITLFCTLAGFCVYYLSDMDYIQDNLRIQLEEYFTNTLTKRLSNTREEEMVLNRPGKRSDIARSDVRSSDSGRMESNRAEGRKKKNPLSGSFFSDMQDSRNDINSVEKTDMAAEEENYFTEEDLQYLRQSLERIAAGKDRSLGNEKKHQFSAKEEKVIDDILREYFT